MRVGTDHERRAEAIARFLELARTRPYPSGGSPSGQLPALGPACFVVKTKVLLGLWDRQPIEARQRDVQFVQSFQVPDRPMRQAESDRGFVDPVVVRNVQPKLSLKRVLRRMRHRLKGHRAQDPVADVLRAESKQAIATLADVGARPREPYRGFPGAPDEMRRFLVRLDWSRPWGAGAHAACMAVFATTEAPALYGEDSARGLAAVCRDVIAQHADDSSGAWFAGPAAPTYGQLVNGAMKVLTALEWLEVPPHAPERLIDSVLAGTPDPDGCHLVDAVYVLHRCAVRTPHRQAEVRDAARQVLAALDRHWHDQTGGFSYFIGRAQTSYYGVPVSNGPDAADIHGTVLLTWAMVMALDLLDEKPDAWRVIRP